MMCSQVKQVLTICTGNYALYRMASAKKGPGVELLSESEKNDYDWLKTPPATPLFPSLEMEANAPELVLQHEIPITQPLSRVLLSPIHLYLYIDVDMYL